MSLERITAPELGGLAHGFFTRKGGVSTGIYAGLNCGGGSDDNPDHVRENRARVAAEFGARVDQLANVHQVHSADAITLSAPLRPVPKADGLVTTTPGLVLTILTADCQPVLFADESAGVIGAAHAGWKGALGGVLDATVARMEAAGATRANITAVIGPTISQAAYEVGPEFRDAFLASDMNASRFFKSGKGDRFQFDLPGFSLARLRSLGLKSAVWTGHCTYGDPARFYSYRRTTHAGEPDYGRMVAAISL